MACVAADGCDLPAGSAVAGGCAPSCVASPEAGVVRTVLFSGSTDFTTGVLSFPLASFLFAASVGNGLSGGCSVIGRSPFSAGFVDGAGVSSDWGGGLFADDAGSADFVT